MAILVTGGSGYIGSHICLCLLEEGYEVVVADNLCNSKEKSLERVQSLTGRDLVFYRVDVRDENVLNEIFQNHRIDGVIHLAGLKAVGESVEQPVRYYDNNLFSTIALCRVMWAHDVKTFVFSSSATVYGDPESVPIDETASVGPTNPYGRSKLMIEQILRDVAEAEPEWKIVLLRYFNPVGAHASGEIGEDANDLPNNLMPYISKVAVGSLTELQVFGDDYPTPDGTGVRDYIHVMDLAYGHVKALEKLAHHSEATGVLTYNLGTGRGYSVLEMIRAFENASGQRIPYRIVGRRPGDIAACYADASLAEKELGWKAARGVDEMVADTWRWQSRNPNGFGL
ncbi:MAG: UDP-glucose 4-epimerase GalE [Thermodesulfobacteriota bacterium]